MSLRHTWINQQPLDSPFDSFVGERLILFFDRFRRRALRIVGCGCGAGRRRSGRPTIPLHWLQAARRVPVATRTR
nr:MAG TPA: hypothetical protein [Caudoviricetes sp.]